MRITWTLSYGTIGRETKNLYSFVFTSDGEITGMELTRKKLSSSYFYIWNIIPKIVLYQWPKTVVEGLNNFNKEAANVLLAGLANLITSCRHVLKLYLVAFCGQKWTLFRQDDRLIYRSQISIQEPNSSNSLMKVGLWNKLHWKRNWYLTARTGNYLISSTWPHLKTCPVSIIFLIVDFLFILREGK